MNSLSLDLRRRIVEAYHRAEGSAATLARRFDVSPRSVQRLLARSKQGDDLTPKPHGGGRRRALSQDDEHFLAQVLQSEPDLTQQALVERLHAERGLHVSRTPVRSALWRLGFTLKKRRSSPHNA